MKIFGYLLPVLIVLVAGGATNSSDTEDQSLKRYIPTKTGYIMVLHPGDNVLTSLEELASTEQIPSASFSGLGFVNATFGFFNNETKTYEPKTYEEMELAGLNGSIAWQDGKPSVHMHGVATGKKFEAVGGHLLNAIVGSGSVEIYITVYEQKLERKKEATGANVLHLR